jgi:hypothetical protein
LISTCASLRFRIERVWKIPVPFPLRASQLILFSNGRKTTPVDNFNNFIKIRMLEKKYLPDSPIRDFYHEIATDGVSSRRLIHSNLETSRLLFWRIPNICRQHRYRKMWHPTERQLDGHSVCGDRFLPGTCFRHEGCYRVGNSKQRLRFHPIP